MSDETFETTAHEDEHEGPDGSSRDPSDNRPPRKRWATPTGKLGEPDPFPQSDTAVSQADGAA